MLLWSLSKQGATAFVSAILKQEVSFSPLSLLNCYLLQLGPIIWASLAYIAMNCETKSVLLFL